MPRYESIKWSPGAEYVAFLDRVSEQRRLAEQMPPIRGDDAAAGGPIRLELFIDENFLQGYTGLADEPVRLVLDALRKTPITHLNLQASSICYARPTRRNERMKALCIKLSQVLGAISTITSAGVTSQHDLPFNSIQGCILESLSRVIDVSICCSVGGVGALIMPLRRLFSLERIFLHIPSDQFPMILPALESLPLLTSAWFMPENDPGDGAHSEDARQALAAIVDLLHSDTAIVNVKLAFVEIDNEQSNVRFCEAIARGKLQSLDVSCCNLRDPGLFARVVASPYVKELRISEVRFSKHPNHFMNDLASCLSSMAQLERLSYTSPDCSGFEGDQTVLDAGMFARALSECPNLVSIDLHLPNYTADLDKALADCVSRCSRLERMKILSSEVDPASSSCPKLLEAMKGNYTLKQVDLGHWLPTSAQTKCTTLCLLNKAGRGYMGEDAMNKHKAISVLEKVNENIDCLFTHLCENPLVCTAEKRVAGEAHAASCRKRKALHVSSPARRLRSRKL